jgi:hypothetical protein
MKNLILIVLFFTLCISCENTIEKNEKPRFDSIVWIFDTSIDPDSLKDIVDNYMTIDTANANFNGDYLGDFRISHDTLRIVNISYLVISADSMKKQESLVFEGIVTKHTNDSLILKRLRGYFPLKYRYSTFLYDKSDRFIFYNEDLLKKNNQRFEELAFSNSLCYGRCPAIACEIDSNRNIKFFGGSFSKKKGYYYGKVNIDYFNKLNDILSFINLEKDSTIYPVPVDAPANEIRLKVNKKINYFTGSGSYYPHKMLQLYILLLDVAENSNLQATKDTIDFKTSLHYPLTMVTTTVKFIPPPKVE